MTLKTKQISLTEKLEFKKDETTKLKIPLDNLIRRIELLFTIVLETPAAMTAGTTALDAGIHGVAKKVRLVMNGDENKFNVDAFKSYLLEKLEKGTPPKADSISIPAAGATASHEFMLNYDFASVRQDLRDTSALLPAVETRMSSLQLEIDWGGIAELLGTVNDTTVKSGEVLVTLTQVFDDDAKAQDALTRSPFIDIREGIDSFEFTKAFSSYDDNVLQKDITPSPANILLHLLVTKEDITKVTGQVARANDIVTRVKVENTRGAGEKVLEKTFKSIHYGNKGEFSIETLDTGVALIDWIDERRGGLANFDPEAIKWRFLTNAPATNETDAIDVLTRYVAGILR